MADKTGIHRHVELLQKQNKTVAGINVAPLSVNDYPYGEVNGADMPIVLTVPGPGEWRHEGFGLKRHDRAYRILVIVGSINDGIDNEVMATGIDLLQRFGELYVNDNTQMLKGSNPQITLKATNEAIQDTGFGDDSIVIYADSPYRGFEFTVGVYEKWEG